MRLLWVAKTVQEFQIFSAQLEDAVAELHPPTVGHLFFRHHFLPLIDLLLLTVPAESPALLCSAVTFRAGAFAWAVRANRRLLVRDSTACDARCRRGGKRGWGECGAWSARYRAGASKDTRNPPLLVISGPFLRGCS